jgi:hypothetical protein
MKLTVTTLTAILLGSTISVIQGRVGGPNIPQPDEDNNSNVSSFLMGNTTATDLELNTTSHRGLQQGSLQQVCDENGVFQPDPTKYYLIRHSEIDELYWQQGGGIEN